MGSSRCVWSLCAPHAGKWGCSPAPRPGGPATKAAELLGCLSLSLGPIVSFTAILTWVGPSTQGQVQFTGADYCSPVSFRSARQSRFLGHSLGHSLAWPWPGLHSNKTRRHLKAGPTAKVLVIRPHAHRGNICPSPGSRHPTPLQSPCSLTG